LTVDVATDSNRCGDGLDIGLLDEERSNTRAEDFHITLREVFAPHKLLYPIVGDVECHDGGQ